MKNYRRYVCKVGLPVVLFFVTLILFQNCGSPYTIDRQVSEKADHSSLYGNGEGYGGKPSSYVRRSSSGMCPDGSDIEAEIVIKNDKAYVVREDCEDTDFKETDIANLGLMPHNPENLAFGTKVFDREGRNSGYTSLLCRGSKRDPRSGNLQVADALIRKVGEGELEYTGRVILGIYNEAGVLLKSYDMGEVNISPPLEIENSVIFNSLTIDRNEFFTLDYSTSSNQAFLTYAGEFAHLEELGFMSQASAIGDVYGVDGLTCFDQ